jgi:phosphopentomutase
VNALGIRRVVLITLDGLGVGALPDATLYGDEGVDTLGHLARGYPRLRIPHLLRLGLGNLHSASILPPHPRPHGCFGRMAERSAGKDTTTGHWELAGLILSEPLATFPQGFPPDIIAAFERMTGLLPLGNIAASGTDILQRLGEEHVRSARPIVYTSVDSVFQIAAHEDVIPVERLYELCRIARTILDPYRVGRVIARPFIGQSAANFQRTTRRRDFSLAPVAPTILDRLLERGLEVIGVGKIGDIFAGRGLSHSIKTSGNADGMSQILQAFRRLGQGIVFANLVDFDMLYGHRRDLAGFAEALETFDAWLPLLIEDMGEGDMFILTADHGCDPSAHGTDHTREYVPLVVWGPGLAQGVAMGTRATFADVAATLGEVFGCPGGEGVSFADLLRRSANAGCEEGH